MEQWTPRAVKIAVVLGVIFLVVPTLLPILRGQATELDVLGTLRALVFLVAFIGMWKMRWWGVLVFVLAAIGSITFGIVVFYLSHPFGEGLLGIGFVLAMHAVVVAPSLWYWRRLEPRLQRSTKKSTSSPS